MLKGESLIALGLTARLRVHQLQLVAGVEHELGVRLWRHADPIDAWWRELCAVGLDGDLDARGVERVDKWRVELQQRLATGAHDKRPAARRGRPVRRHRLRQRLGRGKLATIW